MPRPPVDAALLVVGDLELTGPVAAELRKGGCRVTLASTLSELREILAAGLRPTVLIVDARLAPPWRADALLRMTALAGATAARVLCIGELGGADGVAPAAHRLPADASVAAIVKAVRALQDGHPPQHVRRPSSHPGPTDG